MTEAGTSKLEGDPGLHNKPLGCGASEVYASGPACEKEEEPPGMVRVSTVCSHYASANSSAYAVCGLLVLIYLIRSWNLN